MRQGRLRATGLLLIGLVIASLLTLIGTVSASEFRGGDQCVIEAGEVIESDVYLICNTLTVEGTIRGDIVGGAWSATFKPGSSVDGDIWLAGGQLQIEGAVADDIRFLGVDLDLTGRAQLGERSDLTAVALNVEVWRGATLPGDLIMLGYQAIISGVVQGDVFFNGSALAIGGTVEGNVDARVGSGDASPNFIPFPFPFSVSFQPPGLTVQPTGQINGSLTYRSPRPGNINGQISGAITYTAEMAQPDITQPALSQETGPIDVVVGYLRTVIQNVLSLMVAGVIILIIAPAWIREPSRLVARNLTPSFGGGLILTIMAAPIILLILLTSVLLFVILSIVTLGGFTGMALLLVIIINAIMIGGFTLLIFYMARLVVADLIGRAITRRFNLPADRLGYSLLILLVGIAIYALLTHVPVPYVGLVIDAVGVFIGLGAIALHSRRLYQRTFQPYTQPALGPEPHELTLPETLETLRGHVPGPPPDSSEPSQPGLSSLPQGFQWWESSPPPDQPQE